MRAPEREDHERNRDPARSVGEAVDPLVEDGDAEAGAAHAGEGTADERVRIPVANDVDAHRVRGGRRLADSAHVQPGPRPRQVQGNEHDADPGGVDEPRLREDDRAEDRKIVQAERVHGAKPVPRRRIGEVEIVPEIGRKPGSAREDRQRQARDDLARPQGDDEKGVD